MILVADTETTGVEKDAKMVELGFIEVAKNLYPLNTFNSLIDPEMHIPFGSSAVHHILDKRVASEPTVEELFDIVLKSYTFSNVWLVCHNVQFDARFLSPFMNITTKICTLRAAKRFYPNAESYKLMALAYELELDIPEGEAHRALYDCQITLKLLERILQDSGLTFVELAEILNKPQKISKITFGKHKGCRLEEIPKSYIVWLLKQDSLDYDLRWSLEELLKDD